MNSIDQEYAAIEANARLFNKTQTNPFNLPEGFHKVIAASGRDMGLGHYCVRCKLHTKAGAENGVKHCGRIDTVPTGFFSRAAFYFKLKTYTLPRVWN
jgi:hypothetical protein